MSVHVINTYMIVKRSNENAEQREAIETYNVISFQ